MTLVFHNVGALEHEFIAGTAAMKGMGYGRDWLAKANAKGGETGQFEFGCFVEGDYESGMRGVLVVSGSASSSAPAASPASAPSGHAMEGDGMDAEGH